MLGMTDRRNPVFSDQGEYHDPVRDVVVFAAEDGKKSIQCAISDEALCDHFGGDGKNPLKVFLANRERIWHEARRKYLAEKFEPDGSVLLRTEDIG